MRASAGWRDGRARSSRWSAPRCRWTACRGSPRARRSRRRRTRAPVRPPRGPRRPAAPSLRQSSCRYRAADAARAAPATPPAPPAAAGLRARRRATAPPPARTASLPGRLSPVGVPPAATQPYGHARTLGAHPRSGMGLFSRRRRWRAYSVVNQRSASEASVGRPGPGSRRSQVLRWLCLCRMVQASRRWRKSRSSWPRV